MPTSESLEKKDEVLTSEFVTAMRKMASGETPALNSTVDYLLSQLKQTQVQIEEEQKKMMASQESILALRGRSKGLESDLSWQFHNGIKDNE